MTTAYEYRVTISVIFVAALPCSMQNRWYLPRALATPRLLRHPIDYSTFQFCLVIVTFSFLLLFYYNILSLTSDNLQHELGRPSLMNIPRKKKTGGGDGVSVIGPFVSALLLASSPTASLGMFVFVLFLYFCYFLFLSVVFLFIILCLLFWVHAYVPWT